MVCSKHLFFTLRYCGSRLALIFIWGIEAMRNIRSVICYSLISSLLLVTSVNKAHAEWGDLLKFFTEEDSGVKQSLLTN